MKKGFLWLFICFTYILHLHDAWRKLDLTTNVNGYFVMLCVLYAARETDCVTRSLSWPRKWNDSAHGRVVGQYRFLQILFEFTRRTSVEIWWEVFTPLICNLVRSQIYTHSITFSPQRRGLTSSAAAREDFTWFHRFRFEQCLAQRPCFSGRPAPTHIRPSQTDTRIYELKGTRTHRIRKSSKYLYLHFPIRIIVHRRIRMECAWVVFPILYIFSFILSFRPPVPALTGERAFRV